MEPAAPSLDIAKKSLLDEGFVDLGDQDVGEHVWEFEQREFPFYTEDGMDFLLQHILRKSAIRSLVSWFFGDKRCVLAHCLRYGAWPGHIESFLGGRDAGRGALMVHLLAKRSTVDYYAKSHLHVFPAEKGARLTRELSQSALLEAGCEARGKNLSLGGSVILDARLGCEIREGYAITIIFMSEDLVARFRPPPMRLRNLPGLKTKVAAMQELSQNIGLNFVFGESIGTET
ncbi:hypothetical protein HIM_12380 [Hirsutella minnesotensis 3608]|uniref:Uncharacterized protein n=1 Tax=Hirsutella minnesotensis 3608 TaxID=1043627 RepID=A0A0F8A063_9HYPO|nr:hypothetical protein HIM_12380 [Hirsutella minnesotensis 3608]